MSDDEQTPSAAAAVAAGASAASAPRRAYPVLPLLLLAVAAALLWVSSRMTWVTLDSSDGLTQPKTDRLNGGVWFGALTPLALVLLASIAAVLATRGWLRRMVGILLALVAAVAAVPPFALLSNSGKLAERAAALAELPGRAQVEQASSSTFAAIVALVGAIAAFIAGVLLAKMPAETARLSGKYDNPVFRRAAASRAVADRTATEAAAPATGAAAPALSERVLWDALDAGTDPTVDADRPEDEDISTGREGKDDKKRSS